MIENLIFVKNKKICQLPLPAKKEKPLAQKSRPISKEEFLRDYSDKEDGYKYEFNNGTVEKTTAMNQEQARIFFQLRKYLKNTAAAKEGGDLITKTDVWTSDNQLGRPDILFFTAAQIE